MRLPARGADAMRPQGSPDDDSVYVTERKFLEDPAGWSRRADDAPRVVVTSDDGARVHFVIIQQREPLDIE